MDRLKELKEARSAAMNVINRIDSAISSLNSANSCGIWDLFGGKGFSSIIKRSKIADANANIEVVKEALKNLNEELEDVNMTLPSEISNSVNDNIFDVWFDNIFTDIRVQGEIKQSLTELKEFRNEILNLIDDLDEEIKEIEK